MPRFVDSVNLPEAEWQRLLSRLDLATKCTVAIPRKESSDRREDPRLVYRRAGIPVIFAQENQQQQRVIVCSRNISSGGIGLLHGSFVHSGTRVEVYLPLLDHSWMRVTGKVAFCRHLTNRLHEIGCQFDDPISLDLLVDPEAIERGECDFIGDELEDQRVLIISDEVQSSTVATQISEVGAQIYTASSIDEAVSMSREHVIDLIVIDYKTAKRDPGPMVARLRAERYVEMIAVHGVDIAHDPISIADQWSVEIVFGDNVEFEALIEGVVWVLDRPLRVSLVD